MEQLVNQLMAKVGLDREKAEKVVEFLKENAHKVPEWLGGSDLAKGLMDKLGGLFGPKGEK